MSTPTHLDPLAAAALTGALLAAGAYLTAVLRRLAFAAVAGHRPSPLGVLTGPARTARWLATQQAVTTERPDRIGWTLAPAAYLGLAALALSTVPLAPGVAVADVPTGIVVFGAAEALAIVAVYLHGWSPNSALALVAGYRFVGVALSYELLSMFVLIAAALPAESLSLGAIVESQADLWNVVRQPLGLPLWLVVSLGVTFTGPLALVDGSDLAGGGATEDSGAQRLAWTAARAAMLAVFAAAGAAVFLGGWHGPGLPGGAWMALKSVALLAVLAGVAEVAARVGAARFVRVGWTVLLPAAFLHLAIAGVAAL